VGTHSDIRDQRYRTEPDIGTSDIGLKSSKSDIISDIGINFCPISNIQLHYGNPRSAVVSCLVFVMKVVSSKPVRRMMCQLNLLGSTGKYFLILDIGISDIDLVRYRNGSLCRYRNYSDIGIKRFSPTFFVPISE
jgi:hypothetical protein